MQTSLSPRFRLGILLAHLTLIPLLALGVYCNNRPLPFNTAAWMNEPWMRQRMIAELMNTEMLLGKSLDEIKTLLGPPDTEAASQLMYRLNGNDDSLNTSMVVITFANGRAVTATQRGE